MIGPRWYVIDPWLMIAMLAPKKEKQEMMLNSLCKRHHITIDKLRHRLIVLEYRWPVAARGYAAIVEWEAQVKAIIKLMRHKDRIERALERRVKDIRYDLDTARNRPVSIEEAAFMFRVPKRLIRNLIDLELLVQDRKGRLTLTELRRYFRAHGWWMLKNYRFIKRNCAVNRVRL